MAHSRSIQVGEPSESRCSQQPTDTCNFRKVTSALPAFWLTFLRSQDSERALLDRTRLRPIARELLKLFSGILRALVGGEIVLARSASPNCWGKLAPLCGEKARKEARPSRARTLHRLPFLVNF
ncbi:hypothetical protein EVAR_52579_1 [Eumeta japonica]|uniref:Uncharacterized protein n=1 Tax=Eumeta variegata TaxID=151549 RepID=A0A4C1YE70_EUMVA|nr:hypothetical protein EVAR_52579_1 [Eumeta japonica]